MSKTDTAKGQPETTEPAHTTQVLAKVSDAYAAAVDKASATTRDAIDGLQANPLAALLGGLALGAAAGALLGRSEKEKALLAPLGEKIATAAQAAIAAGREAGQQAIAGGGLTTDALREQVSKLVSQATSAAGAAGTAAFTAASDTVRR